MKNLFILVLTAVMLTLTSCNATKKTLGLSNVGPDETKVKTNPPLTLPPEYNVRPQKNGLTTADNEEDEVGAE